LSLAVGSGSAWFVTIFNINFGSQSGLGRCCADQLWTGQYSLAVGSGSAWFVTIL